ncbi:hypothetical protein [Streptomyces sp. NPDC006309]|uniref:hypothetical protein n=1 Tax=Streptomyces sp. NPDC006309 TaxID=3156749 RepID=UPI0033A4208E
MAAPALSIPAHIPAQCKHVAEPSAETDAAWLSASNSETAYTQTPLTSEPPLPDAEPLTSEPPFAETVPPTSESDPVPASFVPGL